MIIIVTLSQDFVTDSVDVEDMTENVDLVCWDPEDFTQTTKLYLISAE